MKLFSKKFISEEGFTLIELLVVIVIIGVLAAIALPIFLNQQKAAIEASQKSDLKQIRNAVTLAQIKTNKSLFAITGQNYTAIECFRDTNIREIRLEHPCMQKYFTSLEKITEASGIDVTKKLDPYGNPYLINPNETELGINDCRQDTLGYYSDSFVGNIIPIMYEIKSPLITANCSR